MPLPLSISLSDPIHGDDDTICARVMIRLSDERSSVLLEAIIMSAFWKRAVVSDYDVLRVAALIADVDALVVAIFDVLGAQIREFGTDHVDACYPDFRGFLADHLPPAVAARLDAALCLAMPKAAHGDTISFSV